MFKRISTAATALLVASLLCVQAFADPSPKAQALMRQANVANGYMDKQLHDDFWAEVRRSVLPDPTGAKLKEVQASLKDFTLKNSSFPLEGWKSAKLSLEQKKVVRTPELIRQTKLLKSQGNPDFDKAIANTDLMLTAAATGKPMTANGRTIYINAETINQVLDGMEASLSRLSVLTSPVWTEELLEQQIPKMKLDVLTHEKFAVSALKDTAAPSYLAARNANTLQEQIVTISFKGTPGVNLDAAVLNSFKGATASSGMKAAPMPTKWRGLDGVTAQDQIELGGSKLGMAILIVKRPEDSSLLMVMAMADGSENDAGDALDTLLKRIKLN